MAVHALPAASALANSSRGIDGRREPSLEARSTGTDCCRNALCVPKTRFCNIGDEVRRGLAPRNLTDDGLLSVESRCGAVAVGRTYLFPPLSSGGALVVRP
jgi:hypothetical protein